MEPVVHFGAVVALIGRFPALAEIDLDVARGEIVLLRGPNGAGKTTLLRVCAGLVPIVRGRAVVLGHDLRRDPRSVRRRVGLLGHATGLYDELTAAENVRFWGRAAGAERADVEAALALVGLDGRLRDVPAGRLSAGQRRRASLAALLARRPELWLLDEPHAGLDAEARDQLDDLVRRAVAQGATVLLSSHELDRAEALADRVVDLVAGTTVAPAPGTTPDRTGDERGAAGARAPGTRHDDGAAGEAGEAGGATAPGATQADGSGGATACATPAGQGSPRVA